MNRLIRYILPLLLTVSACATRDEALDFALEQAGDNRAELEKVLAHYAGEPQKLEAARWIIANMPGHSYESSNALRAFADSLLRHPLGEEEGNRLWDSLCVSSGKPQTVRDIAAIDSRFLISDIDKAFEVWQQSQWRDEVDFETFKRYVLPYRALNELLRDDWRDSLYRKYAPVVAGATNAREAFQRLRKDIRVRKVSWSYKFSYLLDPVSQNNFISNVCIERCVYFANVCRAMGLPVAIDNVGNWTNYSSGNHSWVALVLGDSTYTIVEVDSIARIPKRIDSSLFKMYYPLSESYPYTLLFKKRHLKIWRNHFWTDCENISPPIARGMSNFLCSPKVSDVSAQYGLNNHHTIASDKDISDMWLCIHALQKGWIPAAYSKARHRQADFRNMADSVLLLPVTYADGEAVPVGHPFFINGNDEITPIVPDTTKLVTATLKRKYPMIARWINRYRHIPGAVVEGSNDPQFRNSTRLCVIEDFPVFRNLLTFDRPHRFRYLRITSEKPEKLEIASINVLDSKGDVVYSGLDRILDMQHPREIHGIEFFPRNDGNFVEPGHTYELAYWDYDRWVSLGRRESTGYELTFDNIPSGALLILHDLTAGKEERPFTLRNGRQVWW